MNTVTITTPEGFSAYRFLMKLKHAVLCRQGELEQRVFSIEKDNPESAMAADLRAELVDVEHVIETLEVACESVRGQT